MLFLLWSLLSTCLESENKSVRSKKFGKNFKFSRVKFRKTNSNIWKNCQRSFIWIVTTDFVSLSSFFLFYFLTLRAWLWGKKNDRSRSKPVQGSKIILQSSSKKGMRNTPGGWGERGPIFFSPPPAFLRSRACYFPLGLFYYRDVPTGCEPRTV